ncbi:hypothetical protein QPK24_12915 [Paenibacillus polygoni]|uniref:Uncharacterized protein n=1 Tax=Paenibacillus polygoni TaxID=3050112 RepID=A0ABY8X1M0_9BACL|nr:hypothetical protein [Paenibacillus polygoni]WIV17336.1 hypothetical protein QPK24_12915 [Paenibacillus polygoni]
MGILKFIMMSVVLSTGCLDKRQIETESNVTFLDVNNEEQILDNQEAITYLIQKEFNENEVDSSDFKEGVSFDLNEYVQDFFSKDIADKIQGNLKAIVDNDEKIFVKNMLDDSYVESNLAWLKTYQAEGMQYDFQEVNEIKYLEEQNRIQVVVSFLRKEENKIQRGILDYSLLYDQDSNEWLIATMDGN